LEFNLKDISFHNVVWLLIVPVSVDLGLVIDIYNPSSYPATFVLQECHFDLYINGEYFASGYQTFRTVIAPQKHASISFEVPGVSVVKALATVIYSFLMQGGKIEVSADLEGDLSVPLLPFLSSPSFTQTFSITESRTMSLI